MDRFLRDVLGIQCREVPPCLLRPLPLKTSVSTAKATRWFAGEADSGRRGGLAKYLSEEEVSPRSAASPRTRREADAITATKSKETREAETPSASVRTSLEVSTPLDESGDAGDAVQRQASETVERDDAESVKSEEFPEPIQDTNSEVLDSPESPTEIVEACVETVENDQEADGRVSGVGISDPIVSVESTPASLSEEQDIVEEIAEVEEETINADFTPPEDPAAEDLRSLEDETLESATVVPLEQGLSSHPVPDEEGIPDEPLPSAAHNLPTPRPSMSNFTATVSPSHRDESPEEAPQERRSGTGKPVLEGIPSVTKPGSTASLKKKKSQKRRQVYLQHANSLKELIKSYQPSSEKTTDDDIKLQKLAKALKDNVQQIYDHPPTAEETSAFAQYLGMDVEADLDLFYIAEWAMTAPLPADWSVHLDSAGNEYFYNPTTAISQYEHPMDATYRQLYLSLKQLKHE